MTRLVTIAHYINNLGQVVGNIQGFYSPSTFLPVMWTIKFTPQEIEEIITMVEGLVDAGKLTQGEGNALIAKLSAAQKKLSENDNIISKVGISKKNQPEGNTKAVCNILQAFINQVRALIKSGRLSAAEGQKLIDAADNVSVCN